MVRPSSNWYAQLASITSLGFQHRGAGSLAGLHEARAEHLSQFFTPTEIVGCMWQMVLPAIDRAIAKSEGSMVSLFDNSIGSARMFQFADPARHSLSGFDVHAPSVDRVARAAGAAGFHHDFIVGGLEDVRVSRKGSYGVALINPPFSIHLESPHLVNFPICSHGKFGPGTSCFSHVYAVAQALSAADIVAAVLPLTFAETLEADSFFSERLRYIGRLPNNAFASEGANVSTAIAVWDRYPRVGPVLRETIENLSDCAFPDLNLTCRTERDGGNQTLQRCGIFACEPTILTPFTGDSTVRVVRHNRNVILKFKCGLTEAKVRNAILVETVDASARRYPVGVKFSGQGKLDLEIHLMQPDPVASFQEFVAIIETAGGRPAVDPGIFGYLRRRARRMVRHQIPFGHVIKAVGVQLASDNVEFIARETFLLDPKKWGGPVLKKGSKVPATRSEAGKWSVYAETKTWTFTDEEANRRFVIPNAGCQEVSWVTKFKGRNAAFPVLAKETRKRAERLGIDEWLTWDFQMDDLIEVSISPNGSVVAHDMGLGKTRLAISLMILGGSKANLHVTEPHLVPEVVAEIEALNLPASMWQVIDSPGALQELRRINIISYNRLRLAVHPAYSKYTYAKALRHRIGTMIADEGHCLRNLDTDQTQAAWNVAARRRHVFTGTVIANYPRDSMAILAWVGGSATAAQPYGIRNQPFMKREHVVSMNHAERGVDHYCDNFVTLEWVTNEFRENLQAGGKREVPKIGHLPLYREMLAPFVKRRVKEEPEVAKFVRSPKHTERAVSIDWSPEHLAYYLDIADNFAGWYRQAKQDADKKRQNLNMIALLARIGAVETACNVPQAGVEGFGAMQGKTSKQVFAVEHIAKLAREGHKILVYAKRPQALSIIESGLTAVGIESVVITGERDIEERTKDLRDKFRKGPVPVCLASLGCTRTGLNIPEADRIVYLSRDWSATTERQANARALRPQQKKSVVIEYLHLPGSIDEYQAQMVEFKGDAADAGLDWATPQRQDVEFEHLDTVLGRFVERIAQMRGMKPHELRTAFARKRAA